MRKNSLILRFAALAVLIAFAYGMVELWGLRFDSGDIYSPYSSLRTDPLGVRAFYESLEQLPGAEVRRNYRPLKKLTGPEGTTLFYLGIDTPDMPIDLAMGTSGPSEFGGGPAKAIHSLVSKGGRAVVSFSPLAGARRIRSVEELFDRVREEDKDDDETHADDKKKKAKKKEKKAREPDGKKHTYDSLGSTLGLSIALEDDASWQQVHDTPAQGSHEISSDWPDVEWHGGIYFKNLSNEWKVIYKRGGKPVIVERAIGSGTIAVCADTYFLSNEAMVDPNTRNPKLLAWLAGNRSVVFDETHLGVASAEGIASLAREHGLANLFFVLLVIAGLYIWKSSVSFLPRDPEHAERFGGQEVSGRSSAAGLHNLLRKCIPIRDLLSECLKRWSASASASRPRQRDDQEKIRAIIAAEAGQPARRRDPVRTYTTICRILAERKK